MDESLLIDGIVRGDEIAEADFVARFAPRIRASLGALGVPRADVDDVCQEVLIDAFRQLRAGKFRQNSTAFTWLWKIVKGKALDHFGSASSKRQARTVSLEGHRLSTHVMAEQEALLLTADALRQLPAMHEMVFRMKFHQGRSDEEIAAAIGRSIGRTRNLITEARERFAAAVLGREPGKNKPARRLKRKSE